MATVHGDVVRQRPREDGTGTPGSLVLDNGFSCDTQELGWHGNERGKSCTAAGVDRGRVWYSPTLKRYVIKYEDRNGRKDCEVHNGNLAGDVDRGQETQVHGCTEVGNGFGVVHVHGKDQFGILHSVETLEALIASLDNGGERELDAEGYVGGYDEVEIRYQWAPGCAPEGQ